MQIVVPTEPTQPHYDGRAIMDAFLGLGEFGAELNATMVAEWEAEDRSAAVLKNPPTTVAQRGVEGQLVK